MCDRNPGEINFGSSWCKVRVIEGLSYWESTVFHVNRRLIPKQNSSSLRGDVYPCLNDYGFKSLKISLTS